MNRSTNPRRGLALGCGGTVGGAWQIGALAAIERALGWDARDAELIVGTSAGATAAAMLGAGVGVDEMLAGQRGAGAARDSVRRFLTEPPRRFPAVPGGRPLLGLSRSAARQRAVLPALAGLLPPGRTDPSFLDSLIDDLVPDGGWVPHPGTWVIATEVSTARRAVLGRPGSPAVPMREAVRASWAVPGWYPPVRIAGADHLDGGVLSTASADVLAGAGLDEVIVVAPMAGRAGETVPGAAGRVEALLRRSMTRVLEAEIATLRAAGVLVRRVHPGAAELASMGPNFMDPRRRIAALDAALAHVPGRLAREQPTADGVER